MYTSQKTDRTHLKTFGILVYAKTPKVMAKKFEFQMYTSQKTDRTHLKTFGILVYAKTPKVMAKTFDMDKITRVRFLHYNATGRNITYIKNTNNNTKTANHTVFDEAS